MFHLQHFSSRFLVQGFLHFLHRQMLFYLIVAGKSGLLSCQRDKHLGWESQLSRLQCVKHTVAEGTKVLF